jgi:excisionase family DNA binding protein
MKILTLAEAGDRLGLSASTLRTQVRRGRLHATLVGKTWTVTEREVERYRAESLGRPGRRHAPIPDRKSSRVPANSTPESAST